MCLSIDELLDIKSQGFVTREISRQLEPQERTVGTGTNSLDMCYIFKQIIFLAKKYFNKTFCIVLSPY